MFGNIGTPAVSTAGTGLFTGLPGSTSLTVPSIITTSVPSVPFTGLGAVTTTVTTPFTFGQSITTPSISGFGIGTTMTGSTSATPSLGFNLDLGSGTGISATTVPTTAVGLGGVDFSQSSAGITGASSSLSKSDSKAVKENLLPNEIATTIDSFKKYVKEQKVIREEISRVSSKPILKVQDDTAALKQLLSVVSNGLQRNAVGIAKLKQESAEELKKADLAQRTKDTPPALQYENTAPTEYFHHLVACFERQMLSYHQQIDQLERHLVSLSQPPSLTPNELSLIMRRLHETFVALASQLQTVHEAVQNQKDQFLLYRRNVYGESNNIFATQKKVSFQPGFQPPKVPVTLGPSPFSTSPSVAALAMASAINRTQQAVGGTPLGVAAAQSHLGTSMFGSGGLSTGPTFGSTSLMPGTFGAAGTDSSVAGGSFSPFGVQNKPFQLQKPPLGNKRGKRWTST